LFEYSLREEPEGFWVVEERDQIVGFTISWIRSSLWFLSCLFVLPEYHGMGVRRALIEKALEHRGQAQTANHALITAAYNPVSLSLYLSYGIYSREPLYWMYGSSDQVLSTLGELESVSCD